MYLDSFTPHLVILVYSTFSLLIPHFLILFCIPLDILSSALESYTLLFLCVSMCKCSFKKWWLIKKKLWLKCLFPLHSLNTHTWQQTLPNKGRTTEALGLGPPWRGVPFLPTCFSLTHTWTTCRYSAVPDTHAYISQMVPRLSASHCFLSWRPPASLSLPKAHPWSPVSARISS